MVLVNGCQGVGTGFSTYIPCYNPEQICQYLINKIDNKELFELNPYYQGFQGDIIKLDENSFMTRGKYRITNYKSIEIYESKAKYFACVRYGGYSNSGKFKTHSKKLIEKLSELNIKTIGDLFYVSYNSPYKVFNRRNEVMVEIEYED